MCNPDAPEQKQSWTVRAHIYPSPNPVSASAIIGSSEKVETSLITLQNSFNVLIPISGTPEEAVTAAPDIYNALNPCLAAKRAVNPLYAPGVMIQSSVKAFLNCLHLLIRFIINRGTKLVYIINQKCENNQNHIYKVNAKFCGHKNLVFNNPQKFLFIKLILKIYLVLQGDLFKLNIQMSVLLEDYKQAIIYLIRQRIQNNNFTSMSSHPKYPNYLTAENGCSVTYQSSERERGPASSILSSNANSVWVTNQKVPQQCVISLRNIIKKPLSFNFIGFYCWHQYDSNPALIQVWIRGQKSKQWQILTKVRLNMLDIWQYFKIDEIVIDKIKELKLRIMQNFGDSKTYLNKVGLFSLNPSMINKEQQQLNHIQFSNRQRVNPSIPTVRDKTYSEHTSNSQSVNLAVSNLQKQLQKANQNIAKLTAEQQYMKKTIIKQEQVIIQIQQKFKAILDNIEKMRIIQSGCNNAQLLSQEQQPRNIGHSLQIKKNRKNKKVEINEEVQQFQRNYKKKEVKKSNDQQKRIDIQNLKSQLHLMEKNSIHKNFNAKASEQSNIKPSKSSGYKRSAHHENTIGRSSDDELTEYVHTNYKTSQSQHQQNIFGNSLGSSKGDKAKMLQRLKKLIELKEMKKLELKKSSAAKGVQLYSKAKRDNIYQQDYVDENGSEDGQQY